MKKQWKELRPAGPQSAAGLCILADGCLMLLALIGTVFSFVSAYGIQADRMALFGVCLTLTLLSLIFFALPKRGQLAAILLAAVVFASLIWKFRITLWEGGLLTAGKVAAVLQLALAAAVSSRPVHAVTCALSAAAALLAVPLAWAVLRGRSAGLTILLTAPWLLPALVVEAFPDWLPLMLLAACWCVMLMSSLCWRDDPVGGAGFSLLCLPPVALLLALLSVCVPREAYRQPAWTETARTYLEDAADHFLRSDGAMGGLASLLPGSGADVSVRLDEAGPRNFTGRTVLRVQSEHAGRVYLRGTAAAVYTGDAWLPLEDGAYAAAGLSDGDGNQVLNGYEPLNFPSLTALGRPYYEMVIEYPGSLDGCMFTPYQLATTPDEISEWDVVNATQLDRNVGVREKNLYYKPDALPDDAMQPLPWAAAEAEAAYRAFVHENYLDVPDSFPEIYRDWALRLQAEFDDSELSGWTPDAQVFQYGAYGSSLYTAGWIAHLLDLSTEYDLQTPYTPEGEDFVGYFLNESHRGYCVHYASAGVLLLRAYGIPARYVSGYTAELPAAEQVSVPDSAAHAWVEIYLDGYGWYPVDMTPASATGITPESQQPPAPAPAERQPEPERQPAASQTPARPDNPGPQEPEQSAPQETAKADAGWLWTCIPLCLAAAVPLRSVLTGYRRRRRLYGPDVNAAVIAAYGHLGRLAPWGARPDAVLGELARKARFSQHRLTEEERTDALASWRRECERVMGALPRWKRWYVRWILAL